MLARWTFAEHELEHRSGGQRFAANHGTCSTCDEDNMDATQHPVSSGAGVRSNLPRERKMTYVRVVEIEIDPAQSRGRREIQVSQFNGVRCLVTAS